MVSMVMSSLKREGRVPYNSNNVLLRDKVLLVISFAIPKSEAVHRVPTKDRLGT